MAIYVNGKLVAGGGGTSGGSLNPDDIKDLVTMKGSGKIRVVGELEDDTAPYDIEFRTEDEDPGDGVPAGGTQGQILAKKSNSDYDIEWIDKPQGGSGGGSNSASDITYNNKTSGTISTNVQEAIDELFQSGSEGKALIASAITSKGVETEADASFQQMKENIEKISSGINTSDATATELDILKGKTAYVDGQKITGQYLGMPIWENIDHQMIRTFENKKADKLVIDFSDSSINADNARIIWFVPDVNTDFGNEEGYVSMLLVRLTSYTYTDDSMVFLMFGNYRKEYGYQVEFTTTLIAEKIGNSIVFSRYSNPLRDSTLYRINCITA